MIIKNVHCRVDSVPIGPDTQRCTNERCLYIENNLLFSINGKKQYYYIGTIHTEYKYTNRGRSGHAAVDHH